MGTSSLTRDWTRICCIRVWSLSHWTTREVPRIFLCHHLEPKSCMFQALIQIPMWSRVSWLNRQYLLFFFSFLHYQWFIYFFKIFIFTLFYFTILYWFCHTLTWIRHGYTWIPNPEPASHLPCHIISLDHPHAPAPSILYPTSNIDWWFISYMIVYMFQCHSPKSSHLLPLPLSPKVRSIHLCLICCLAYRVIIAIFLNSIYMC